MNDTKNKTDAPPSLTENWSHIAERSQKLIQEFLAKSQKLPESHPIDPLTIGQAFCDMTTQMMHDPMRLYEAQISLWTDYLELWNSTARKMSGQDASPVITPNLRDRRFKDAAWDENQLFDFIKQSYLLSARWLQQTVDNVDGLEENTLKKVDFYTRQFVDAMAPTNFLMTNPEVLRTTFETNGENLVNGLDNLLKDLENSKNGLQISMTDTKAFEVGQNIAITEGAVVYQNDLMQLIQYKASTESVSEIPLVIVPPWINKYYILDLKDSNSLVKWAVEQGQTVFIISWVNPDERLAGKGFDNYLEEGVLTALKVAKEICQTPSVNALGFCLGGTLLSCALAYLKKHNDTSVASATFLATMTDFSDPGELSVFIDEEQIIQLEKHMQQSGYLEGTEMAASFNMLRANDLIWNFVVNNYLLGKDPFPFDLLYWNSDNTRMPAAMHSFYLRNMYQKNALIKPGGITLLETPIHLSEIDLPVFILSTREDHIAPWQTTYAATQIYSGDVTFCLSGSGHIAGIINPPTKNKYPHWTNANLPPSAEDWFKNAEQHSGSWWPRWENWLRNYAGESVPARILGNASYPPLQPAPGSYVKK